ncbi:TIGR03087 family PEP-CTERM/XrtA system glycosyltransferase [Thalassotalea psychrophila]|uniref:TIGR03087 family PEP-CTERM/XrtA system glycosyltransferase n=1 Tax=Thalassotalea psychrophila TaxID=3065647 RepID=A0ABY9TUL9_9GAMM|nr:TIGR03087 family PEP-CTERM/XrtA system glycosyltransferase [Colwelliaceae bacterium SQ149]
MKILFITQRVPFPPNKGEKIRTFHQIQFLAEQGHEIRVACPVEKNIDTINIRELDERLLTKTTSSKLMPKLFRYLRALIFQKPISTSYFYDNKLQEKINKLLSEEIDIVICSSSSVMEYIFKTNQLNHSNQPKIIVDFMDLDSDKWLQYVKKSTGLIKLIYSREAKLLQNYEYQVQQNVDHCLFTSEKEVDLFKKSNTKFHNVESMGNGLDTAYFQPVQKAFNENKPTFIFTGVMDYLPNVDAVEWFTKKVWPNILTHWPKARFIIAGMKPTEKVCALNDTKGVEVTGFVSDIREYYQQADFFVAPLRIARGVQNKILQGFACNIPVISTPNAIQGIKCEQERDLLVAESEEEFFLQIKRLIEQPSLRKAISANALALVIDNYSWSNQLKKLDSLINNENGHK